MSINFPTSLDSLSNPAAGNPLNAPSHAQQHSDANDAIEALEAKVGANSSAVTTSHDYKLSGVTGSDKAASKTGIETLTNKTLTAPKINVGSDATGDMYYRDGSGIFQRLPAGADGAIISYVSGLPITIPNPAASDASTTLKGVVELATQAEVDAGTDTGGTTAKLVGTPSTIRAKLLNSGVADTGSSTAYVIAPSPAITAYATYQEFTFKATNTNTTSTPTLAVNGLTAKTIIKQNGAALGAGDIIAGEIVQVEYDGTNFQLISTPGSSIAAPIFSQVGSAQTFSVSVPDSTVTKIIEFTGLTGDSEDEYIIEFEASTPAFGNSGTYQVRINDSATSSTYQYSTSLNNTASAVNTSPNAAPIATASAVGSSIQLDMVFGSVKVKASKTIAGTLRGILSNVHSSGASGVAGNFISSVHWTDTSTQITSLQIYVLQASGSPITAVGKARIYKIGG